MTAHLSCTVQWQAYGEKAARNAQQMESLQRSGGLLEKAQALFSTPAPVRSYSVREIYSWRAIRFPATGKWAC